MDQPVQPDSSTEQDPQKSKVGRLIVQYELDTIGDELVRRWTTETADHLSLRKLADLFNQQLLQTAMQTAGLTLLDGEVENLYQLLTDEKTSAGMRTQAETTLQRDGIAVEDLRRDFVSHQAIHTYLTKYRDAESPTSESDLLKSSTKVHQRLQSRLKAVVENNLQRAREQERIALGSFSITVDVRVYCEDCRTQQSVAELLENHGCACNEPRS